MSKFFDQNTFLFLLILFVTGCGVNPTSSELTTASSNRGILNGQMASSETRKDFDSIVYLTMIQGKKAGHCTGSYIGNGMILTAYHCIGLNLNPDAEKVNLKIRPGSKTTKAKDLVDADYEAFFPEAESFMEPSGGKDKDGKQIKIKVPNPDLAILKIKNAEALGLGELEAVTLAEKGLQMGDKDLKIAGFGIAPLTKGSPLTLLGTLFYGGVEITSVDTLNYKMLYQNKIAMAAAQPGDSGGPLFSLKDGKITQYGVASFIRTLRVDPKTKETTMLLSNYVRLDREPVQKWLKETLGK